MTAKTRQTNFELLRIIAMFMVMMLHANFIVIGEPAIDDFINSPGNSFIRLFFECISIVCVNVFVMISGWFGIRASVRGLATFLFQCIFLLTFLFLFLTLTGQVEFSIRRLVECTTIKCSLWFIPAYIGLYLLSPILNIYVENVSRRKLGLTIVCLFIYLTLYGWIENKYNPNVYGTFIEFYLIGRYLRLYGRSFYKYGVVLYWGMVFMLMMNYLVFRYFGLDTPVFSYINPLIVLASCGLVMWCGNSYIPQNKIINFVAKSSFAVYVLHDTNDAFFLLFKPAVKYLYDCFDGVGCIVIIFFALVVIFAIATIVDQLRKLMWNRILKCCDKFGIII